MGVIPCIQRKVSTFGGSAPVLAADDKDKYLYRALNDHDVSSLKSHGEIRPTAQYLKQVDPKNKCSECSNPSSCPACHVGTMVSQPSNFISTTKDSEKAKRYASGDFGFLLEWNTKPRQIDRTKLPQDKIKDLSTLGGRVTHLGSDWDRTDRGPWNHEEGGYDMQKSTHKQVRTRAHIWSKDDKEVLVEGAIPKDCIVEIGGLRRRAAGGGGKACKNKAEAKSKPTEANRKADSGAGATLKNANPVASNAKRVSNSQTPFKNKRATVNSRAGPTSSTNPVARAAEGKSPAGKALPKKPK
ncbi:hypothetical protein DFJ73DRAFT_966633 [Zopfochytrium polystomum]|nr:hypothetical protein DFJ73DRAFT_966633 [Zopfochytrium polystomum]